MFFVQLRHLLRIKVYKKIKLILLDIRMLKDGYELIIYHLKTYLITFLSSLFQFLSVEKRIIKNTPLIISCA